MKIYVASHSKESAIQIAEALAAAGHQITSRWLFWTFNPTSSYPENEREKIAADDIFDVVAADAVVLEAGPEKYSGGKFIEVGIALGRGKQVYVLGRRENMLLWHPLVQCFDSVSKIVQTLR